MGGFIGAKEFRFYRAFIPFTLRRSPLSPLVLLNTLCYEIVGSCLLSFL